MSARELLRRAKPTKSLLANQPILRIGAVILAAALAVTGLFGGLSEARGGHLPVVALGAVDRGEPWDVTIDRVILVADFGTAVPLAHEGDHWFAVAATVKVTAEEPFLIAPGNASFPGIVSVSGVPGVAGPYADAAYLTSDATNTPTLNPGVPDQVVFLWERGPAAPVPDMVTVTIYGETYRVDSLSGSSQWMDATPRAEVRTSVVDRRAETQQSASPTDG